MAKLNSNIVLKWSNALALVVLVAIVVFLSMEIKIYVIDPYFELEQKKLELERDQFEVQAAQTNRSLQLQAANETIKLFDILMNSRLVDTAATNLLGTPKDVSNQAKDLAVELIKRFNVNLNCAPKLWLCDNRDKTNVTDSNESTCNCQKCQNALTNSQKIGNNNRENICFACQYT